MRSAIRESLPGFSQRLLHCMAGQTPVRDQVITASVACSYWENYCTEHSVKSEAHDSTSRK